MEEHAMRGTRMTLSHIFDVIGTLGALQCAVELYVATHSTSWFSFYAINARQHRVHVSGNVRVSSTDKDRKGAGRYCVGADVLGGLP